ncbi:Hypothetical predicted protein [Olea europaea subsp. europaea]|uniref:Uncharacterized protein n=1 Tax=Olea europaea subsp. europaea TaxID=158383 RepID=A0A8S0UM96_OLEEU|nr:Hypothetical predicted protein [Olea europaea subsp. europaea]
MNLANPATRTLYPCPITHLFTLFISIDPPSRPAPTPNSPSPESRLQLSKLAELQKTTRREAGQLVRQYSRRRRQARNSKTKNFEFSPKLPVRVCAAVPVPAVCLRLQERDSEGETVICERRWGSLVQPFTGWKLGNWNCEEMKNCEL